MADDAERPAKHGPGGNIFVSFGPWIAVWVLTSSKSYVPGMLVATGLSIALIAWSYLAGQRPKLLDWGTLVVLALLTVVAVVGDEAWLGNWLSPLLNGSLLAVMVVTFVIGRPFTIDYAKEDTPPELWDTPQFKHINMAITGVWILAAAAMTVGAVAAALVASGDVTGSDAGSVESAGNWGVTVVALVVALKFTAWYPDHYVQKKLGIAPQGGAA